MESHPRPFPAQCIYCGDCIKGCPTEAWSAAKRGYLVRVGGKGGHNLLLGTMFALFLPAERVVEFIDEVLNWYKQAGAGQGRTRLGTLIVEQGAESLLEHLREKFGEYVAEGTLAPQVINIQVGKFAA